MKQHRFKPGEPVVQKFTKFVPSEIDLAPSYEKPGLVSCGGRPAGGYARVSICQLWNQNLWRVAIWGADDLGFEIDLPSLDQALYTFNATNWVYGCPDGWRPA